MSGPIAFLDGRVTLHAGDCREALKTIASASIDSVVTDPPYALVSIGKRFGAADAKPTRDGDVYARASAGFMGKQWDTGETAFAVAFWTEVLRVLRPGGHVVAFAGTRTYHRLACAVEDAGFEIRDQLAWTYGTGFPKSHDQGDGRGTALKPAWEPIVFARRPLSEASIAANLVKHGTGALNVDACRIGDNGGTKGCTAGPIGDVYGDGLNGAFGKPVPGLGRFPANILHDGSDEVLSAFPAEAGAGGQASGPARTGRSESLARGHSNGTPDAAPFYADSGSAARFFYSAKADADDRIGSKHPTVKPVDLMRWLCRLVTPAGGVVLDPFAGTGTTGEAAWREGFCAVLCEREPEYQADITRRMALAVEGPATRRAETAKARARAEKAAPLFDLLNGAS